MVNNTPRRIAVVDLLFCWPPNGGADVDLYHVLEGLTHLGVDVTLFVPHFKGVMGRGCVSGPPLPFPVEVLEVGKGEQRGPIIEAIKDAVEAWRPDAVVLTHGYALKAHLALALQHYPLAGRYYAHELLCARDPLRFKDNMPCPYNYLDHPDRCRRCALETLGPEIRAGNPKAWAQDYLLAEAYTAGYHKTATRALDAMERIIVYNTQLKTEIGKYRDKVVVIPGGVSDVVPEADQLPAFSLPKDKKIIFMSGRVEDPAKGLSVLIEAGARLLRRRDDFHIAATHFDPMWRGPFFSSTGWLDHTQSRALMTRTDICVVPSLWQEPFGLVAVEAMIAGVPVCASNTGGLRDSIGNNETGFLFPPGDATTLAHQLERLLEDDALRKKMGTAGRSRAKKQFTWKYIIDNHYLPLIESLTS